MKTDGSLNLLRFPRRVHALDPGQVRAGLMASVAGILMGCAWGLWQQMQQDQLLVQRAQWQTQSRDLERQKDQQAIVQEKARLQLKWGQRAQSWQLQRQQLMRLHAALAQQAADTGLRVERWQGDGRKLVLQAWLPHADSVPVVLTGLSSAWPAGWALQSMGVRSGAGVDVVLQATWPAGPRAGERPKP